MGLWHMKGIQRHCGWAAGLPVDSQAQEAWPGRGLDQEVLGIGKEGRLREAGWPTGGPWWEAPQGQQALSWSRHGGAFPQPLCSGACGSPVFP